MTEYEYTIRRAEQDEKDRVEELNRQTAERAVEVAPIEMMVTHNDGTVEYLSDIDSIGLLATKDYGITYYGELKGR